MKLLKDILDTNEDIAIESIIDDSRLKNKNSLFCAIKGIYSDGHDYVDKAIENGAVAVLASKKLNVKVPVIVVDDTCKEMNSALNKFYDRPLDKLKLIGVTGTDGKSTTTNMIYQILNKHYKSSIIGTEIAQCDECSMVNTMTTPLPCEFFEYLHEFIKNDCKYTVMEVSSERLVTNRMNGIKFDISVFTNISPDHLDTHKTMENYVDSKCKLFRDTNPQGLCVVNKDDPYAPIFIENATAKVITYGIKNKADIYATDIIIEDKFVKFKLNGILGEHDIISPLSGMYNVYNLLAAIGVLNYTGININDIVMEIKQLQHVAGRNDIIDIGQPFKVIVDIAHTANGWKVLYDYVRPNTKGKIISVFGSKGKHEHIGRRSTIGKMICDNADHVIITTEDPKFEDTMTIINDGILKFVTTHNYEIILDREEAIKKAIEMAKPGDTILITGKGRMTFLDIKGVKMPYPGDGEVARRCLKEVFVANK